ncbi:MAG: endolytic transglycosylase MltG [Erysipelotrichaceae bacterium]|nr:endolytic transglycosylase MltG [Erysipelotrichaceae bacterium]
MKKITKLLLTVVILLVIVLGFGFLTVKANLKPQSTTSEEVEFVIEDNWYGRTTIKHLASEGIIKNADITYYVAKLNKTAMNFQAGTYIVDKAWDYKELFAYLCDGNNAIQNTVTLKFGEGMRVKDFAKTIGDNTTVTYDEILSYWNNEDAIRSLMPVYPFLTEEIFNEDVRYYLEGYLFPDTYEFYYKTSPFDITVKFLDRTLEIYNAYKNDFNNSEYSVHELFTLASIVQRESGNKADMDTIASVFYNRLDTGMQIQSSVTVCYALDIGLGGDWAKCEITQTTFDPYNTYQIIGLPPGPISAPGKDALDAVLNPADTEYFFFIGDVCGGGETIFAKTYAEQLENQARYLTCY